jgi:hypothetical protein
MRQNLFRNGWSILLGAPSADAPVVPENFYLLAHNDLQGSVPLGEFAGICDNLPAFSLLCRWLDGRKPPP